MSPRTVPVAPTPTDGRAPETQRPRRRLGAAALVAVLVVALVAVTEVVPGSSGPTPAGAQSTTPTYEVPPLQWGQCADDGDEPLLSECATALVPLDHDRPDGALIPIALRRVEANGTPDERIGSLFINPGGPGGSGTEFTEYEAASLSPEMREAFDVVGFDPRGVGDTQPDVECGVVPQSEVPDSTDPAAWQPYVDEGVAARAPVQTSCVVAHASWFANAGTVAVARDLDLLRAAVGDEGLTYHGISYGTRLGSVYAQLFGDNVRAMVLDGNMDPFGDDPSFFLRGAAEEDAFALFRSWAPEAGVQFDEILAVLADGPVPVPGGDIDSRSFRTLIAESLPAESTWPAQVVKIAEIHQVVVGGGSAPVAPLPDEVLEPVWADEKAEVDPEVVFWAVMCQDNRARPTLASYASTAAAQVSAAPLFGFLSGAWIPGCGGSPVPVRPIPRLASVSAPPVLLVHSRHDPETPFEWGQTMLSTMAPGSEMVVYEGAEHGTYSVGPSACVTEIGDSYLLAGDLPADTVSCPFVPPAADAAALSPSPATPPTSGHDATAESVDTTTTSLPRASPASRWRIASAAWSRE